MAKINLIIIVFTALVSLSIDSFSQNNKELKFWVWMHYPQNSDSIYWETTFDKLNSIGIQGVLLAADKQQLESVIPIASKYNIEIQAWIWTLCRSDAPKNLLSVNANGKSLADEKAYVDYYKFMSPAPKESLEFIQDKIDTLLIIKGLKGIHLDYLRYVDVFLPIGLQPKYGLVQDSIMPQFDYGYHPEMIKKYKEKFGVSPMEIVDYLNDTTWLNFRLEVLNNFVNSLTERIKTNGKEISAAVFPEPSMAKKMVRQDWGKWNLNMYFPMVYHKFYNQNSNWIGKIIEKDKAAFPDKPIYCGLYLPDMLNGNELLDCMKSAIDSGADGIAFYDYNSLNDSDLRVIKDFIKSKKK